jgi:hypothetical protein
MFGMPSAPKTKQPTGPVVMWVGRGPRCAMPLPEGARVINPIPPRLIAPPPVDPAPNSALIDPAADADPIIAPPDVAPPAPIITLIDSAVAAAADPIMATPDVAPPAPIRTLIDPDDDADPIIAPPDVAPPAPQPLKSLPCISLAEASFVQPDVLTSGVCRRVLRLVFRRGLGLLCPLAPRPPPLSLCA